MSHHFDLVITADDANRAADFRLLDEHGVQIAFKQTDFTSIGVGRQQGLFDLRNFLRNYVEAGLESAAMAEIGVCIAEEVLGDEIFSKLWPPQSQRTLRVQLPGAADENNHLAAALARVPWEIARPSADQPTLGQRNLLVRVVHDMQAPASQPLQLAEGEALRVLFVFAEARGSQPLSARQERLELQQMFEREVYPHRRVVAHFLSHGVTRDRLESQIRDHGGYHVVHWSGHGHLNMLELARPGGESDHLSGEQLLELFTKAGGFLPKLVFLSACHSGGIASVKDWNDFIAVAKGQEPAPQKSNTREAAAHEPATHQPATRKFDLSEQPGFTGTAHALLRGGVPSVVAMRYAVSDDYARELSVEFYRALLAHPQPKNAAAALTLARQALLNGKQHDQSRLAICDHATPLLYGDAQTQLVPGQGRSTALDQRERRLHRITELTTANHEHFVGRTWELAGLGADFIGNSRSSDVKPLAVITGLGGMGKTALVAEALALWERQFDWLALYQAKPNALGFDAMLRDIDLKLRGELGRYHQHLQAHPADAIHRESSNEFGGVERLERLTRNLVRALKAEPILLVIDNFETNLKPAADGQAAAHCQDPAWDECLALLARELVGSPSRVLITCRRPLAVLDDGAAHTVQLGPLPAPEAALFLRANPALSRMLFADDASESALAQRLLKASRFHPLLMDRLARLAGDATLRRQLLQALDALEHSKAFGKLPALFATTPGDAGELDYLYDALATSLDQLIREACVDARRVLWLIAVANEPVTLDLLRDVWKREEDTEQAQLRQMKELLDKLPQLPPELQVELIKAMPEGLPAVLDALPLEPPVAGPELAPLLHHLISVGLATELRSEPGDNNPDLTCHELVRERIRDWMAQQPNDRGDWTENMIRLAYAERLETAFKAMLHQDMSLALQAGSRALVYCVQAEAWDSLRGFASSVVTGATDPRSLEELIPHLQAAAEAAPEGRTRLTCLYNLATALNLSGHADASLPFFERIASIASTAAEVGGDGAVLAWTDLAVVSGGWAVACLGTGDLDRARLLHLQAATASKKADRPAIYIVGSELEALRIEILQGRATKAWPQIQARLAQIEGWWRRQRGGEKVPEAPHVEYLARAYIGALSIANDQHRALNDWNSALRCTDTLLDVKRELQRSPEDIAGSRMNRAVELIELQRFAEARSELDGCLQIFQSDPFRTAKTLASLAALFDSQGDAAQAINQQRRALALFERLPNPVDRAGSHINLASFFASNGAAPSLVESSRHQLAALAYCLVAKLGGKLEALFHNYAVDFQLARDVGTEPEITRLADLLADPAFHPLDLWLRQRQANLDELQAAIDQFLDHIRKASLE
jgi:tetratricopeptide (TPR) repeat protein